MGFDFVRGPIRFQATAYDSHVSNLLTYRYLDPSALPPGFSIGARLINAGSATSRGFEGELNWQVSPHLSTLLSYTYADSIVTANTEDPASVGVQQPGIPKNRATLGVNWSTFHGVEVSPHLRYLSRTSGDPDNIYHTDPDFIADLSVTAPLTKRVQAFAQVENLLSRTYVGTNDGFTAPLYGKPFTAVAGFRVKIR